MKAESLPYVIIGAGGFGRECFDVLNAVANSQDSDSVEFLGFVDSNPSEVNLKRLEQLGATYLGAEEMWWSQKVRSKVIIGVGNPQVRKDIVQRIPKEFGVHTTLIHPTATIGSAFNCGIGVVVCAGAILSTNVQLGDFVHINPGAVFGHDANIGDYVSINPAAVVSGETAIGDQTLIGANATVLQGLQIGEGVVGASACVVNNIGSNTVVKGVPAK